MIRTKRKIIAPFQHFKMNEHYAIFVISLLISICFFSFFSTTGSADYNVTEDTDFYLNEEYENVRHKGWVFRDSDLAPYCIIVTAVHDKNDCALYWVDLDINFDQNFYDNIGGWEDPEENDLEGASPQSGDDSYEWYNGWFMGPPQVYVWCYVNRDMNMNNNMENVLNHSGLEAHWDFDAPEEQDYWDNDDWNTPRFGHSAQVDINLNPMCTIDMVTKTKKARWETHHWSIRTCIDPTHWDLNLEY